jgi:type II secretory pathway component GspD/PulD (secretin)
MRSLLFAFALFFVSLANASPVVLNFDNVELPKFIKSVYSGVLGVGYTVSPDVASSSKRVTIQATVEDRDVKKFVSDYLASMGVSVASSGSAYVFALASSNTALALPISPVPAPLSSLPATSTTSPVLDAALKPRGLFSAYTPAALSPNEVCAFVVALFGDKSCSVVGITPVLTTASQSELDSLLALLQTVDRGVPRVRLTVSFIEVTSGTSDNLGLTLAGAALGNAGLSLNAGTVSGAGALSLVSSNTKLVIDALLRDSRFKQVSSPSGFVSSGSKLTLNIGDKVPTLSSTVTSGTGLVQQSINYQNSGVVLDAVPTVVFDADSLGSTVYLDLKAELSSFKTTTTGVNTSPTLSLRGLNTRLSLRSGEVVVLGGLTSSTDSSSSSRLFGVVPFGSSSNSDTSDLLLVVSASVVPSSAVSR